MSPPPPPSGPRRPVTFLFGRLLSFSFLRSSALGHFHSKRRRRQGERRPPLARSSSIAGRPPWPGLHRELRRRRASDRSAVPPARRPSHPLRSSKLPRSLQVAATVLPDLPPVTRVGNKYGPTWQG